jgi:hypothetical protein
MSFRKRSAHTALGALILAAGLAASPRPARATLPAWLQHIVGASTFESALYRAMKLPEIEALYPRPPQEAQSELARLLSSQPDNAELYQLRARADEQALDESAAEADWKLYAAHAKDPIAARLELADFYQRRLAIPQEIATLKEVAAAPPAAADTYTNPTQQRSWLAFERMLGAIEQQGLPPAETSSTFTTFLARYPGQPSVYAAFFAFQLRQHDWAAAESLLARYRQQFPQDAVFPVRAQALLEYSRGNIDAALAVYDRAFQPLWPPELIQSYFELLNQTHRQRAFVADARAQLAAHPDGAAALNAVARIFYYDQQAGRLDAAEQTLDAFRSAREAAHAAWTPVDLYTLETLSDGIHQYAEAARYNDALAGSEGTLPNGEPAAQFGLAGLVRILLEAPDQPLPVGAQNLTLYRDIATLDQGPGYWNGILSLWLNGTNPASEYNAENARAQGYFHRSKAAELLADLDKRFPNAPERPALHLALIRALTQYGEPARTISASQEFLADFPVAPERLEVASLLADAYATTGDTAAEFALYEAQLAELAPRAGAMPLTAAAASGAGPSYEPGTIVGRVTVPVSDAYDENANAAHTLKSQPLAELPAAHSNPDAVAYVQVLDRYLGRLTATGNLPRALTVLRAQLDRTPNDPVIYERLADFLQQNNLSAQAEQVYQAALDRFQQPGYYNKLARFYLRQKRAQDFASLTRKVTDTFSGTDLDVYFSNVNPGHPVGPQLALQLNLYAAKRFPHDLVFTRNLLNAYQAKPTRDSVAYEALLRHVWWESDELRDEFLDFLNREGKLQAELDSLTKLADSANGGADPAALRELGELDIFQSHFEQAAPLLGALAKLYPAEAETGDQAVSLYRSLAYNDPTQASTQRAVAIESNLLTADPDSPDRLATLGDLYAEATSTGGEDLKAAAPYWRRIPELHPGSPNGFLTTATIFWDYFQFDDALAELTGARTKFHEPALFGYEAGAIEENRHDLPAAVAEYTNAVIHPIDTSLHFDSGFTTIGAWLQPPSDAGDSNFRRTAQNFFGSGEANARLLQLAKRPAAKAAVDAATVKAVAENPANAAALTLRADVLTRQHHAPELNPLLTTLFNQALDRTTTVDEAAAVGSLAQARNLTAVYERALAKEAALTLDPVQKIQLQYSLARSLEDHDDVPGATRVIEAVYQANPRILGVVRATTDLFVRTKQPTRAIATLLEAAKAANPPLAHDFTLEAASRANDADDPVQARALALGLLAKTPYDARVLDIVATSYAQQHDDAGLKQFYLAQLDAARKAPNLAVDERKQDIALLRRGLIPALTRMQDYAGAIDQYIALLSAYPEDSGTAQEAALYALKHSRQPQLLGFLRTTVQQSPRDSRFMILLAQTETTFGDLPAAESAYSLAIAIRKDRVDLYNARVDLELRLSQSDPEQSELAAADFQRLYVLSYHDPAWMLRLAELRARQQRPEDVIQALETAYINGHPKTAADDFTVASQLADWNLLEPARKYAEQGVALAGDDLLTPQNTGGLATLGSGAATYARILTRLGRGDEALDRLIAARKAAEVAATSPSVLAAEIAREKLNDAEANQFRRNYAKEKRQLADSNLTSAVEAVGETVRTFYTPEQKLAFAQTLDRLHDGRQPSIALNAATAAGLLDREVAWRRQIVLSDDVKAAKEQVDAYSNLERRRLQFAEVAKTLETYASHVALVGQATRLQQAAQAYRDAGDPADELRLLRDVFAANQRETDTRLFDLLWQRDRPALIQLAGSGYPNVAYAALNDVVSHGNQTEALAAVAARGAALPPVWRPASASLVQTYFASPKSVDADPANFTESLGSEATIADRLASPPDPTRQVTGDTFFFYASRFGIFLETVPRAPKLPDAEDFVAAELEDTPGSPAPYLDLAKTYAEANKTPAAVAEYNHVLELTPPNASAPIEDEMAVMLDRAGRRDDAIAHWRTALATLARMQQHAIYPELWFTSLETITRHLGERHLTAAFRPELESILGPYFAKNGNYRSNELLKTVYQASATPADGTSFILAMAAASSSPAEILGDLTDATWLSPGALQAVLVRRIQLEEQESEKGTTGYSLDRMRGQLLESYLGNGQETQAQALLDSLPEKQRKKPEFAQARMVLAAHAGRIMALVAGFRADPESAPALDAITAAANRLSAQQPPDNASARVLREYVFEQKQLADSFAPTDFLSLAQSRIDTNDLPGAIALLNQLTLLPAGDNVQQARWAESSQPPNPYANTDSAAALLEAAHHPAEAIPFLRALVQLVPWDPSYRFRLAAAQAAASDRANAVKNFSALASDATAPYDLRVKAASALAPLTASGVADLGSRELAFLAHPTTPGAARQPYFAAARLAAAALPATAPGERETLLREAIAIAPEGAETPRGRLDLLMAQPGTADASATLAILRSIDNAPENNGYRRGFRNVAADADDGGATSTPASAALPEVARQLDLPAQIRLATQLSRVSERDGDLDSSLGYAQLAVELAADAQTPDPAQIKRRDELKMAVRLERRNATRRPVLTQELAQTIVVRPRLTAADLVNQPEEETTP